MKQSLLSASILLISNLAMGQKTIVQNGHTITISDERKVTVIDPVSREELKVSSPGNPALIDGRKLYATRDLSSSPTVKGITRKDIKLSEYIFLALKSKMESLEDGYYVPDLKHIVIDSNGKLTYWQFYGLKEIKIAHGSSKYNYSDLPLDSTRIPSESRHCINLETTALLQHFPIITPGRVNNRAVDVTGELFSKGNFIQVKEHVATLHQDYWSL